jgi:sarcosine oxidase subunit gamma
MVEPLSPLAGAWQPGAHGNLTDGPGVTLAETRPGSIVQVAAWHGTEKAVLDVIRAVTGLALADGAGAGIAEETKAAFGFAPGKFLVVDQAEGLEAALAAALTMDVGVVTGLSHGRTAIRVAGPKAEWVLAKFFALDFVLPAFPVGAGKSVSHHDVFAQIQRTGPDRFDIYIFRSMARSFWTALCHGAEEVGYEVK